MSASAEANQHRAMAAIDQSHLQLSVTARQRVSGGDGSTSAAWFDSPLCPPEEPAGEPLRCQAV